MDEVLVPGQESQENLVPVTLGANFSATKTTMDEATGNVIWSESDQIKVQVGDNAYTFDLESGSGTSSATFAGLVTESDASVLKGTAAGNVTAYYPTSGAVVSDTQTYAEGTFADGMNPMTATCAGQTLTFTNNAAVVRVKGVSKDATKATLSYTVSETNYSVTMTLTAGDAAKDLYFVVVPGAQDFNLALVNGQTCNYKTSAVTESGSRYDVIPIYTEGSYSAPGIKVAGLWWAPVNCGYDAENAPEGLLYQWGRKYGQSSTTTPEFIYGQATSMAEGNTVENKDKFYLNYTCWFQNNSTNDIWLSEYDPCPAGWRVPTYSELSELVNVGSVFVTKRDITGKNTGSYRGFLFPSSGDTQVFIYHTGYRNYTNNGSLVTTSSVYFSTSPYEESKNNAMGLTYSQKGGEVSMCNTRRACGCCVRCVKD